MYESSWAISINSEEGGKVEDILIQNIVADNNAPLVLTRPIPISLLKPQNGPTGSIKNVRISDFTCKTQGRILLTAGPGTMLENIHLSNIYLQFPWIEDPFLISDSARSAQYSPQNKWARKQRAAIFAENAKNLIVNHLQIDWPEKEIPKNWKLPKRIENGGKPRTFFPSYEKPKEAEMKVFWGSQLEGGYLQAPGVLASDGKISGIELQNCKGFVVK
jgi:hypothetical protein